MKFLPNEQPRAKEGKRERMLVYFVFAVCETILINT